MTSEKVYTALYHSQYMIAKVSVKFIGIFQRGTIHLCSLNPLDKTGEFFPPRAMMAPVFLKDDRKPPEDPLA